MASPQLADGYTCIAHEILEALCRVNLSPYQSRVLWFVLRRTYGHHKKTDRISLSQIEEFTGLDKRNAGRALSRLKKRNIIVSDGDRIGFQKNHEKWLDVSLETRGVRSDTVSLETAKECLQRHENGVSRDTTKNIKIKDIGQAKPSSSKVSDPRIKELRDHWAALYLARCGERYRFTVKDFGQIKSALRDFDLPRLKELAAYFFETSDRWIKEQAGFTIGVFISRLNSLASTSIAKLNGRRPPELKEITI